jgi:hypothetical protein
LEELRKLQNYQDGINVDHAEIWKQKLPDMKQKWCLLKATFRFIKHSQLLGLGETKDSQ